MSSADAPQPSLGDYLSPVRLLPGETSQDVLIDGASLCLSGGGYRAMLFHLGALWRLHELDYLRHVKRISSVSGGSITSAWLGMNWEALYPATGMADFESVIVKPIRDFASQTMDEPSVLEGMLTLGLQGSKTPDHYRLLYGHATLHDIPDTAPEFVFNSTNLQTGSLMRFSKAKVADWRLGEIRDPHTELAIAVAASSAFPPFLSPLVLPALPTDFVAYENAEITNPAFLNHPSLTDGGVYDNLGIETAWKKYKTILVSNADGLNDFQLAPGTDWARQAYRVLMLLYEQVCSLRKRQVIGSFIAGQREGSYWSMASHTADYHLPDTDFSRPLVCPPELTLPIAQTPTRLAAMDTPLQDRIINWGYAICDVAVRRWLVPTAQRPSGFKYPIGLG